jgi:GT2 family glycosyltransferase
MEDPSVGAVASSMRNMKNPEIMDSAGGAIDWMGFTADSGNGESAAGHSKPVRLPFACGGAVMVRRKALRNPDNIFWNELFIYQEDVDLGLELNRTGWKVVYEPKAVVGHEHSATMRRVNWYKEHLLTRNRLLVMRKHFGKNGFSLIAPHIRRWQHAWIAVSILRGRFSFARALFTGTSEGLNNPVKAFSAEVSIFDVYNQFARSVGDSHPLKRRIAGSVRSIIRQNCSSREELM